MINEINKIINKILKKIIKYKINVNKINVWNILKMLIKERVNRLAVGLNEMGFIKGDRLGVWMPTNSEWVSYYNH